MSPKEAINELESICREFLRAISCNAEERPYNEKIMVGRNLEFDYYDFKFLIKSNINVFDKTMLFEVFEISDNRTVLNGDKSLSHIPILDINFWYESNGLNGLFLGNFKGIKTKQKGYSKDQNKEFASVFFEHFYDYLKEEKSSNINNL